MNQQMQGYRKAFLNSSNHSLKWQQMVVLTAAVLHTAVHADDFQPSSDISCSRLYASRSQKSMNLDFWTGEAGENFAGTWFRTPAEWWLSSILSLHVMKSIVENSTWTELCVGLVDSTAYTKKTPDYSASTYAYATLHTLRDIPVGFVRVSTTCYLDSKHFAGCNPSFIPLPFIEKIPLYHYSPLEEGFWSNLTTDSLETTSNWIWKINTRTIVGSVPAHWIKEMNLTYLQNLEIVGNEWKMPEKLLNDMPNLERLDLSYNKLEVLPERMLLGMPNLQRLILGHNNISVYPKTISKLSKLWLLDLTNPIGNATLTIVDEDIEQLPKTLEVIGLENTKLQANVSKIFLLPNLKFLNLSGCGLGHIKDQPFPHYKITLKKIDLFGNNLKSLPQNIFTEMPNLETLILRNNEISKWQKELLYNNSLTYLDVSHNQIADLTSDSLKNLHELKNIDLSWNKIKYLPYDIFKNLSKVTNLDLSYNQLTAIPDLLFIYTPQISEINLSHNMLTKRLNMWNLKLKKLDVSYNYLTDFRSNQSSIDDIDLSHNIVNNLNVSSKVMKMNISYNSLVYIPDNLSETFTRLHDVDLGGNDFKCCQFGNRTFINKMHHTNIWNLGSSDPLTCSMNHTSIKILLRTFVYNETECVSEEKEAKRNIDLAVVLPVSFLILTGTLIAVTMYVYRFELTYVSHLFKLKKVGAETDEQRYKVCTYDAFVCYSARNFEWVTGTLLPGLESGPEGYRLCVHDRDFALGAGINRNIVASLEKSRKVIFVLSQDFIASKWCQWELEMANHKMFEESRNYIILVELERLQRRTLPRHLRYLMDRTTYLEWPEVGTGVDHRKQVAACFRRLREALGDSLHRRTGRDNAGFFTVLDEP